MKVKHSFRPQANAKNATFRPQPDGTNATDMETASSAMGESEVAALAYHYWQERGCPDGCPEEDWFRAERELTSVARQDR